jgi:ABC-type multidrug transport system ATPase subunit
LIQGALEELLAGRTSFVIPHRLSTIRNTDQVLVLNEGKLIERGTHDELMAAGGFHHEFYMSQFRYDAALPSEDGREQEAAVEMRQAHCLPNQPSGKGLPSITSRTSLWWLRWKTGIRGALLTQNADDNEEKRSKKSGSGRFCSRSRSTSRL